MKMLNLKKFAFVMALAAMSSLILCGTQPQIAHAKKTIKLGLLSPFSQPGDAAAGQRMKWGAELAIKYINEEMGGVLGGKMVELVVEDDAGTPADGIAGYRKMVQRDRVVSVVGQFHSSVCLAVNKVARDLEVPLFSSGASSAKITESHNPYIFRIMSITPARAEFWVNFAKQIGYKKIAVLCEDTDYGTGFKTWIEKYGKESGMEVKSIVYPRKLTDLTPMLLEAKAWNPDIILNIAVPPGGYLMVKQAYDIGLFPKVPMVASFSWPTRPEFWEAVGPKGKGILYTAYYKPGMLMTKQGDWVSEKYKKLHGEDPDFFALNVFGQLLVIAQAIDKAESDDPKKIAKALVDFKYTDWSGEVNFEDAEGVDWHNVSPPHMILQQTKTGMAFKDSKIVFPKKFGGDGIVE